MSRGLGFRDSFEILEAETNSAIHRYFGNHAQPTSPGWSEAFTSDPDLLTRADPPAYLEITPFFEAGLNAKRTYPERARRVVSEVAARGVPFDERLTELHEEFAKIAFVEPLTKLWSAQAKLVSGQSFSPLDLLPSHASRVYGEFCQLQGHDDPAEFVEFLRSAHFKQISSVRIFCSLHTAMELNSGKPEASDYDDTRILATVLPYCDIVATDNDKKRLLEELGFDAEFTVTLFSAKQEDLSALIEFLGAL